MVKDLFVGSFSALTGKNSGARIHADF